MKQRLYMDIECFWNYFCVTFEEKDTGIQHFFEISPLENISDVEELCSYISTIDYYDIEMVTFNGVHYDCPVLNYIVLNRDLLLRYSISDQCKLIKQMSNVIIDGEMWWKDPNLKPYKYRQRWTDLDYFLYWSKMLRREKKISLKSIGIQLHYPVVQELPVHHDALVTKKDLPLLKYYNRIHDISILRYMDTKTYKIYGQDTMFDDRIALRRDAIKTRGFYRSCLSWDDVKFGYEILLDTYAKRNNTTVKDLPPSQWKPDTPIVINDLISDKVSFKIPAFQKELEQLRSMVVTDTRSISMVWRQGDVIYDFGSGGLHNRVKTGEIKAPDGYDYKDWDVASEYPSLCAVLDVTPPNLPGFGQMVLELLNHRLQLKKIGLGKSPEANTIKLALNGGMGKLNEEHSLYYYPPGFLQITLNGQLYLLMLCEMLVEVGCIIDMANTDGVSFFSPKGLDLQIIWNEWERITNLVLEEEVLDTVWRTGINEYLCLFENGYTKPKGSAFITEPDLGNSCDNLIIPKAINKYLLEGIPLKDTITNPVNNILDYCASPKVGRKYKVIQNNKTLPQRLNRFFVSSEGSPIYKYETKALAINGYKGVPVKLLNEYNNTQSEVIYHSVDYNWYINQADKIISKCTNDTFTLF